MSVLYLHQNGSVAQWSHGSAGYLSDYEWDHRKLCVAIRCRFGDSDNEDIAMLDTGAPWPIIKMEIAEELGLTSSAMPAPNISTHYGKVERVQCNRCNIFLVSEFGEELEVDGTVYFSNEWPGPNVIGWSGCLERIRFALDPTNDTIYYGKINDM